MAKNTKKDTAQKEKSKSNKKKATTTSKKAASTRKTESSAKNKAALLKFVKDIKPNIETFKRASSSAFTQANEIMSNIVYEGSTKKKLKPVDLVDFTLSLNLSLDSLPGYATLNKGLRDQIKHLIRKIEKYVNDQSQQRPLNFLMLASPGAGKSHFIKCVASHLSKQGISAITFNMSGMQTNDDLVPPLDSARNLKVEDRLPLLFLDEFDSKPSNYPLLLPFLWDGSLNLGQRELKLGKAVVVMAGSDPALPETMNFARSMRKEALPSIKHNPKLVDLLSRINGDVIRIPSFYDPAQKIDRRADKVCIAITLLKNRFGKSLSAVPVGLLRFIANIDFRYDVRSIAHLIDSIPFRSEIGELTIDQLDLPFNDADKLKESSLAYHIIHEDQAMGVVAEWEKVMQDNRLIPINVNLRALEMFATFPEYIIEKLAEKPPLIREDLRRLGILI